MLKYWLWLTNLRGLHNQTRLALLRHFGTPENLFYADEGEILLTEGITREQAALPPSGVRPGQRAVHRVFGPGTVLSFRDPIVEIRFPAKGDKKFVLSDSVQRGLLRLEE